MPRKKFDHTGLQYGELIVLKEVPSKNNNPNWLCQCSCGNTTISNSSNLKSGNTTSCGCVHKKAITKHGDTHKRLYRIYKGMFSRCNNPKDTSYKNYGAKGIKVDSEWNTYEVFKEWAINNNYTDSLTIDRIDVTQNYNSNNCRWVNHTIQARNKRLNSKNTTGYFGVFFAPHINKYVAQICINTHSTHLGSFNSPEEAAKARDNYIKEHNLIGFNLNFN